MIIKIEAVPKLVVEDGVEKVVMGENNQPVWDKERALITTKGGNYRRIVTLTDELAAEVAKGHRYFNAVEKNGKLHITKEANGSNPVRSGLIPLLGFDVWEHAYYLDYQNKRADHINALWSIIDWDVVGKRMK